MKFTIKIPDKITINTPSGNQLKEKIIDYKTELSIILSVLFIFSAIIAIKTYIENLPGPLDDMDHNTGHLSYDEAARMALWLDRLSEEAGDPPNAPTQEDLLNWTLELAPLYEREGVTPKYTIPQVVTFHLYRTGARNDFVAGTSNCSLRVPSSSVVNVRYANPVSDWHERGNYIATLAHELAHTQQYLACMRYGSAYIENSAQIVSWEVLAALANSGNKAALQALLEEMAGRAMGAARSAAFQEGRLDDYELLRLSVSPGAVRQARRDRSDRFWSEHESELRGILQRYSYQPFTKLVRAYHGNKRIGVAYPVEPTYEILLEMDDLFYVLEHAEELIEGFEEVAR